MTTATCPLCGGQFHIVANAPKRKGRHRWPWRWLDGKADNTTAFESSSRQHFNQAVASAQPWQDGPQQQPRESLGAGETVWRRLDIRDIRDPAILGAVGVGLPVMATMLIIGSIRVWSTALWATIPISVILIGADVIFWVMVWPHIKHDDRHLITRERAQEVTDSKAVPQKQERTVEVIVKTDAVKRHDKRAVLPDNAKMHNLAVRVLAGDSFKESTAKACGFSRARWVKLRDLFLDRGWVVWKDKQNHNTGINVMAAGRVALRGSLPRPDGTPD